MRWGGGRRWERALLKASQNQKEYEQAKGVTHCDESSMLETVDSGDGAMSIPVRYLRE